MNTIVFAICRLLLSIQPPHPRLFTDPFLLTKKLLIQSKNLLQSVLDMLKAFLRTKGCYNSQNRWTDRSYNFLNAENLLSRFDTILQLRSNHLDMGNIISKGKLVEFEAMHSFKVRKKNRNSSIYV